MGTHRGVVPEWQVGASAASSSSSRERPTGGGRAVAEETPGSCRAASGAPGEEQPQGPPVTSCPRLAGTLVPGPPRPDKALDSPLLPSPSEAPCPQVRRGEPLTKFYFHCSKCHGVN